MATRQKQLRELRRLLIVKESDLERARTKLDSLGWEAGSGEFLKLDLKILTLRSEAKILQSRISARETTTQKQQKEAASG